MVSLTDDPNWLLDVDGQRIMNPSRIGMTLETKPPRSGNAGRPMTGTGRQTSRRSVRGWIVSPVPEKRRKIPDVFNELTIEFSADLTLCFRAYDDGVAYRWILRGRSNNALRTVREELAEFNFRNDPDVYYPAVVKRPDTDVFHTSFEEPYRIDPLSRMADSVLAFTPVLVRNADRVSISLTEADLEDYPGMFVQPAGGRLRGVFAGYPAEYRLAPSEFPQRIVTRREDYIAKISGNPSLPWRVLMIARSDVELPVNDLVYRLASPNRIGETSWIKPGKGTDEWITGSNLFNVPFRAGLNTATYKYYIDFAKRFGFQRIMMDAGWSDYQDLFRMTPGIDMDSISAYAKQQGIGLSCWTLAMTLERQLDSALKQFNRWGVDFIMTDFMDRDDQVMVQFYKRVAEACAKHRIMVMYHGAFKPAGFNRTYPNAVTREAVLGSEFNIWSNKPTPSHNLLLPFIRMTAGPMDYEPGLLNNATTANFRPDAVNPMAQGTRCQQAAMFVVYESPIQLFSGNISQGLLEPRFMELIGSIPTVWDTTVVQQARLGELIVTVRRSGDDWYVGGMTDSTARDIDLDLAFLGPGHFKATILSDGMNADRYPADYRISEQLVEATAALRLKMAAGGGFVIRMKRQ